MDWRVSLAGLYCEYNGLGVSVEEKGWGGVLEECCSIQTRLCKPYGILTLFKELRKATERFYQEE